MQANPNSTPAGHCADSLLVAANGSTVFVRLSGRGTFKNGAALKEYCNNLVARGYDSIIMDMASCEGMDSTFMGVLAGIVRRMPPPAGITMINVSGKVSEIMQTVGLDQLIHSDLDRPVPDTVRQKLAMMTTVSELDVMPDKRATAMTVLAAHEELISAQPSNLPKFRNVLELMRKEVQKYSG